VSSLLIETAVRQFADGLWTELVGFADLWLRLIRWLVSENERVLSSPPMSFVPWLVLFSILAWRALSPSISRPRPRLQPPVGGAR
jgi:hypothetical protein